MNSTRRRGDAEEDEESLERMMFVEVSHPIVAGMKTYPGLPEPRAEVPWDYEDSRERYQGQAEFFIASLHLCGNTGT